MNYCSAEEAVKVIQSNDRVYVHSVSMAPQQLIKAMTARHAELRNVEVVHLHIEGDAPYANPEYAQSFHVNSLFIGANVRHTLKAGNGSYTPVFLSEIPYLFRKRVLPINVALMQVSPPDKHGFCSLGTSVDASLAAAHAADHVIAQVNPRVPRTHGDSLIHVSKFDSLVEVNEPIPSHEPGTPTDVEMEIGRHVASLVEDGSCLQMGIGAIPNAALSQMGHLKNLGIHTEMFSDGILDLVEKGIINGSEKKTHPGKIISGFVMGSQRLYDFIDDNPQVNLLDIGYVNDTAVIRKNPKAISINSAVEIDLTGQVCADSIGAHMYSGVGGQMDFIRGAMLSKGGKPIIALPSTTRKGLTRIVPFLKEGAGVVTTRSHVHYIVTEYGIADLYGKTLKQRAEALAGIAHPDHRENILREYHDAIH
ncbi:acetyl-CoA hydrolase/transferase family protein [Croceimicrobium hydrocarbonivorans]|uniref:4-hydroxybutyrate CoA-transferase n=1 Tax=Croceimicrobium hydrocarbonivorans TaxID=2761580 RepID=A0A7H0VEF2_9FLAO|nr:acetyl-CoA hydrolase/transferase C-terminal domain-containing protein [Croceimicrobium hydrocarbonivorans]QNR24100.1 4-hydroxybutyrate CoA-transferase [Croceimicrobium hydrocarbonivorans]